MSGMFAGDLAALQDRFLSAPFEPNGWHSALEAVAGRTGSEHAQVLGVGGPQAVRFNTLSGLSGDEMAAYASEFVEIGAHLPDVNWRVAASQTCSDRIIHERHYAGLRKDRRFDVYEEHVRRWSGANGCQTDLLREKDVFFGFALVRSPRSGVTSENDRALFAAAAPMVLAAIRMQHALEHQGAKLLAGALEAMDVVALLCDANGRVQAGTAGGEAALTRGDVLVASGGRLAAARPENREPFREHFACVLRGEMPKASVQRLWLRDPAVVAGGHLCEMFRLPQTIDFGFAPRALVVLRAPTTLDGPRRVALAHAFGLTATETDVALMLAEGRSRDQIAATRDTSVQTVITHIRAIFRKCDASREAEIVALVNRLLR